MSSIVVLPLSPATHGQILRIRYILSGTYAWVADLSYKVLFYKTTCVSKQYIFVCTETSTSIPLQCWPHAQKFVEIAKWPKYLRTETTLTGRTSRPNNLIEHMDQLSGEDSVSMKAWNGSQAQSEGPYLHSPKFSEN